MLRTLLTTLLRTLPTTLIVVAFVCCAGTAFAASATLTWTDASNNEMGFDIERKPVLCGATGTWGALTGVGMNVATYKDLSVLEGGSYCFRLRAWNTTDGTPTGTKQYSAWSNEAGITIPFGVPQAPAGLGVVSTP